MGEARLWVLARLPALAGGLSFLLLWLLVPHWGVRDSLPEALRQLAALLVGAGLRWFVPRTPAVRQAVSQLPPRQRFDEEWQVYFWLLGLTLLLFVGLLLFAG
ncbi:hypothetical protein DAERI_030059 [Deinococcus aerius]|uniref:Uncharacterized protein n=1 Tax=Deinococcus aerius TaxID=200253 RepID=A0A2I9CT31_9DEIO|nr:hypothetical protein [Deinococcus aerius]GBF04893.1 hypothetical protein DAERI_030059 [Deinococcus aerius]